MEEGYGLEEIVAGEGGGVKEGGAGTWGEGRRGGDIAGGISQNWKERETSKRMAHRTV